MSGGSEVIQKCDGRDDVLGRETWHNILGLPRRMVTATWWRFIFGSGEVHGRPPKGCPVNCDDDVNRGPWSSMGFQFV